MSTNTGLPLTWSESQNVRWKTATHGRAWSSPVILGRQVWLTTATPDGRELFAMAVYKDTGKILFDLKLFDVATPQIVMVGADPVLVSPGSKATYGYDPLTGQELWKVEEPSSFSSSTRPVAGHGLVFYSTGWNTGQVLAVKPDGRGDVTGTHVIWRVARGAPKKPSLLLLGDLLVMGNDSGVVTCLDARTGAEVWTARLTDSYSASPVAADGRVYFFSEDGKATVIEAGRAFKVLAENTLDDGFMASPAVDGQALYLRTRSHLCRIENEQNRRTGIRLLTDPPHAPDRVQSVVAHQQ